MRCPACGTSHPSHYEQCVSCGKDFYEGGEAIEDEVVEDNRVDSASQSRLESGNRVNSRTNLDPRANLDSRTNLDSNRNNEAAFSRVQGHDEEAALLRAEQERAEQSQSGRRKQHHDVRRNTGETAWEFDEPRRKRRSEGMKHMLKSGAPQAAGVVTALVILTVSAGATFYFLTKAPESDRLLVKGLKELENGQYAFAVSTLSKAAENNSSGQGAARVQLALARAYIGVDQVEKANEAIAKANQLGSGIAEDPSLASQLANYYRMHAQYDQAVGLLRPLALKNVPGKRAELADLAALWGDEEFRAGKLESALRLWEEVKDLKEGSRYTEADARLATIYQRLSEKYAAEKKDKEALNYLSKLNAIADNPRNYEMAADLYERTGQLELAIDQMRKATKLSTRDDAARKKLALLLTKRGKELLDKGEQETGYAYLQQARSMDPSNSVPSVTMKQVKIDFAQGMPRLSGQVWNPNQDPINSLGMKVEIVNLDGEVLWSKETRVVDEYVPPLGSKEGKAVDITGGVSVKADGKCEFKVYFDGKLYNSYPIGIKEKKIEKSDGGENSQSSQSSGAASTGGDTRSPEARPPEKTEEPRQPSEEKTLKDLE